MPAIAGRRGVPSMHRQIVAAQVTGRLHAARSLRTLPTPFVEQLDQSHDALPSILAAIENAMHDLGRRAAVIDMLRHLMRALVERLARHGAAAMTSAELSRNHDIFMTLGGHLVLLQLLESPLAREAGPASGAAPAPRGRAAAGATAGPAAAAPPDAAPAGLTPRRARAPPLPPAPARLPLVPPSVVNDALHALTDVAISSAPFADVLADSPRLLPALFALLDQPAVADGALTLAQVRAAARARAGVWRVQAARACPCGGGRTAGAARCAGHARAHDSARARVPPLLPASAVALGRLVCPPPSARRRAGAALERAAHPPALRRALPARPRGHAAAARPRAALPRARDPSRPHGRARA